ncbi:MAG: hypothetical protein K2Z80_31255 [Xanthobacteraceae bacterium]|nr:hypothetical protein [Xanthobacteraceae bacterium]
MSVTRRPLLALALVLGFSGGTFGADYPDRPIKLVMPTTAGGNPDLVARVVASRVEKLLKQPIVFEYRPGANTIIGTQGVAQAEPDGYTVLGTTSAISTNEVIQQKLPYNLFRDLTPVAHTSVSPGFVLVVNATVPAKTAAELISYAKSNPVSFGSPGVGNSTHLAVEYFNYLAHTSMLHVPFRGSNPAVLALVAGTVQVMITPLAAVNEHIASGALRALAVTGNQPFDALPGVPLLKDSLPGYNIAGNWNGWFVPARTPSAIVRTLNEAVRTAMKDPAVVVALDKLGYVPEDMSPADFAKVVRDEVKLWEDVVRKANVKLQ